MATLIKILGSEIFFCFGRAPGDSSRDWCDNTNEHFKFEIARDKGQCQLEKYTHFAAKKITVEFEKKMVRMKSLPHSALLLLISANV